MTTNKTITLGYNWDLCKTTYVSANDLMGIESLISDPYKEKPSIVNKLYEKNYFTCTIPSLYFVWIPANVNPWLKLYF